MLPLAGDYHKNLAMNSNALPIEKFQESSFKVGNCVETVGKTICSNFSGPLIFDYVWWILKKAMERKIQTLYFLARDGYTLMRVAEKFCHTFDLPIECKYLFCSRTSLRTPTYQFIGEEAYDLLLCGGYKVSLHSLLERVQIAKAQRFEIYHECGLNEYDEERSLSKQELHDIRGKIKKSSLFHEHIMKISKESYSDTVDYLKQEGLFGQKTIAIVDSGWTGSMQRSLRQLVESAGYNGTIVGFYFGMFVAPKEKKDGLYLTWFFSYKSKPSWKAIFCNNLFECLLSAPHGMTTGYYCDETVMKPVLTDYKSTSNDVVEEQIAGIERYCDEVLPHISFFDFDENNHRIRAKRLILRYMAWPTRREAEWLGKFQFCDDITELYHFAMASGDNKFSLSRYLIPTRFYRRVCLSNQVPVDAELFWPYGAIAFLPRYQRWWYWLNLYCWEWLRYALQ